MERREKLTIRKELFLTGLVFLLTISAAFIAVVSAAVYKLHMDGARLGISGINRQIAAYVDAHFEGLATTVSIMAANPDVVSGGTEGADRVLNYFRFIQISNPNVKYCYSGYDTGKLLINDYVTPEGFDPTVRPWYRSAEETFPAPSIGVPYQEIKDKEWLISVSKAFRDDATGRRGVVAIDSTISRVDGMLNRIKSFDTQDNYVVDSVGTVLVHEHEAYLGKRILDIAPDFPRLPDESGFIAYSLPQGKRLAYYTRIRATDWIIVSAIDLDEVLGPIRLWIAVIVLVVVAVSAVLGAVQMKVYERRFVLPILELGRRVSTITAGGGAARPAGTFANPELSAIASRIEEMTETSLGRQARELALILESTSEGIIVADIGNRVMRYNRRFLELWGFSGDERIRAGLDAVAEAMRGSVVPEDAAAVLRHGGDGAAETLYARLRLKDGTVLEQDTQPLIEGGSVSGRLWSYKDVTAKIEAEEKLKLLASTDSLTGLWNRRHFMDTAEYEFGQAERYRRRIAVAQLDIDHFKAINDNHGHAAGDRALQYLASSLKNLIRGTDTIGRTGGEEFTILFPNTDAASALAIAEKIRAFFSAHAFALDGEDLAFTVSIGVAAASAGEGSLDGLIRCADAACYEAKRAGRNRVSAAEA